MDVVIFHYHLNPGGVTRIIESQITALKQVNSEINITVICGDCENPEKIKSLGAEILQFPELNYFIECQDIYSQYERVREILNENCHKQDILHIHNLNLGKNPLVTAAIHEMALQGYNIINHAHDFSEDRPVNQQLFIEIIEDKLQQNLKECMYPELSNYKFAVLNSFDAARLERYGIKKDRITLLPNPVVFHESQKKPNSAALKEKVIADLGLDNRKKIVTYPVRIIRRKNVAEFILLAILLSDKANFIVTQPPKNPIEKKHYDQWIEFCLKNNLHIYWEAGNKTDFEALLRSSDFCITTSIQEGFGMVYMEPWLLETPVVGRDIDMVTADLKASGVNFPILYTNLFLNDGQQIHELKLEEQMAVAKRILESEKFRQEILDHNPFINELLNSVDTALISDNKKIISKAYSLENYGKKLYGLYKRITT